MTKFVDLGRQFRALTSKELEQPEILASLSDRTYLSSGLRWNELLERPRVLLLAEAGSGKTAEMRHMAEALTKTDKYAFFVALESLDHVRFTDVLSAKDEIRFNAWKADGRTPAWFFLDAVDELKLTRGKLERSLGIFAKAVDGLLDRTRVVVSCRPNDWRPVTDMATYRAQLPIPEPSSDIEQTSEEAFLRRIRTPETKKEKETPLEGASDVFAVILLPLGDKQIESFARSIGGLGDAPVFLEELARQRAWTFARRPLDLSELVANWKLHGKLGSRSQQHEANISSKLKDDPERPDGGELSETMARVGAERLALAMTLMRRRTVQAPDQPLDVDRSETVLDPVLVLPDWTTNQRNALLRRALFDPATYGRVRFHHRSVQEYLAASRLRALRAGQMGVKALLSLLFADPYGERVVIPSTRPVAAWLALWDDSVMKELSSRQPEVLLSLGDPEALSLPAKADVVRRFANAYGTGTWRGINIPIDEVRRLATPELDPVIRDLWQTSRANEDVSELLLELIWQSKTTGCSDIAEAAAMDTNLPPYQRVVAIRALVDSGAHVAARRVTNSIVASPVAWPDRVIHGAAADLFPLIATVGELLMLVERLEEPRSAVSGFGWQMQLICKSIEPTTAIAMQLRDGLTDLIWRGRFLDRPFYQIAGAFDHVTTGLAILCTRQLQASGAASRPGLARACAIAHRFAPDRTGDAEVFQVLRQKLFDVPSVRTAAFWEELAAMDEMVPDPDPWHRYYHVVHDGVVPNIVEQDRTWLEEALRTASVPSRRSVALHALSQLWRERGSPAEELQVLRNSVADDEHLRSSLEAWVAPTRGGEIQEEWMRNERKREQSQRRKERDRLANWKKWRTRILSQRDRAFAPEKLEATIANVYKWLSMGGNLSNRSKVWDRRAISDAFGPEFAEELAAGLRRYWRTLTPVLWSKRPANDRNTTLWAWMYGLFAVTAEADDPDWARRLTGDEARLATALATLELNGFAEWLSTLAESHPEAVASILGAELLAEAAESSEQSYLPTLQDLTYAKANIKTLLSPVCLRLFLSWNTKTESDAGVARVLHALDQLVQILDETSDGEQRVRLARHCIQKASHEETESLALHWLRSALRFDFALGAQAVLDALKASTVATGVPAFAAIFGGRDGIPIRIDDTAARARILGRLVRAAYAIIRREDDRTHEGVCTPNVRDNAEDVRNFLLSALLDTPGPTSRAELLSLASATTFAHMPDRLRLLARERAATDAELPAFDQLAILALDEYGEPPAVDRDSLYRLMLDRIDDLQHDITHHDFSDRRTLRSISEETEMQLAIAMRLDAAKRGAYVVTREDEVADNKRTDIRLATVRGQSRAVIELKVADKRWSIADLEHALEHQVLAQYLRHDHTTTGCLLLTYNGDKRRWRVGRSGPFLNFDELVARLSTRAKELELREEGRVRLAVIGLDLRDAELLPAQR